MSTLSVPLNPTLENFVNDMVKSGRAANKADVVRQALVKLAEDEAIEAVMQGMREIKEGKVLYGDIKELASRMP